mmetsp:Transcript_31763/g.51447  ORF Transcript_31763/g.51447 Transcript_31763/m.51447 type:complete len:106 (+) Transcript_31763:487-804(+)
MKAMKELKECPYTVNLIEDEAIYFDFKDGTTEPTKAAIVMEYCSKGQLYDYLYHFKEPRLVRFYFGQMIAALEAMEEKKIIHRFIINRNNSSLSLSFEIYGIPHP